MEKLGGTPPGAPKVQLPADLDPNYTTPSTFQNPRTGRIGTNVAPGHADPLTNFIDNPISGAGKIKEGVEQISNPHPKPGNTPGTRVPPTATQQIAGGVSKVIRGGMQAATPLLPIAVAAAPVAVGTGLVAGTVAGQGAHAGLKGMGASDEVADLGEDITGLAVGGAAAKYGGGAVTAGARRLGNRLGEAAQTSAETQYNQVLGATTKPNKFQSRRVVSGYEAPAPELGKGKTVAVPGLIERGVTAMTRKGLAKKLNAAVTSAAEQLDTAWSELPADAVVPSERVYAAIDKSLHEAFTEVTPDGTRSATGPDAARGFSFGQELKEYLKSHEIKQPNGSTGLNYDSLRKFRQGWDEMVNAANGFSGGDLTNRVNAAAYRASSDGIRNIINGDNPNIAAINREYSFWKNAAKVMNDTVDRTTGQAKPLGRKMARVGGQAVGLVHGGPAGALVAGEAMDAVEGIITSPGWRTVSAVVKNRLANALTSQNPQQVMAAVSMAQQALPKQPLESLIKQYGADGQEVVPEQKPAGPDWWQTAPETAPEKAERYGRIFGGGRSPNLVSPAQGMLPKESELGGMLREHGAETKRAPIPRGASGPEFWEYAPETGPEKQARYEQLFRNEVPKFAKGGIINRPTLLVDAKTRKPTGLMAEAGPEAIVPLGGGVTADAPTVPKPDAIMDQLGQLSDHKRRVVMIPKGTFPHLAPEGMVTHHDQSGNRFIFNPHLIGIHDIKVAIASHALPRILGTKHGGHKQASTLNF